MKQQQLEKQMIEMKNRMATAKFKFEFMLLMMTSGRLDEAEKASDEVFDLLDPSKGETHGSN